MTAIYEFLRSFFNESFVSPDRDVTSLPAITIFNRCGDMGPRDWKGLTLPALDTKVVLFLGNDKNFNYYFSDQSLYPNVEKVIWCSHPAEPPERFFDGNKTTFYTLNAYKSFFSSETQVFWDKPEDYWGILYSYLPGVEKISDIEKFSKYTEEKQQVLVTMSEDEQLLESLNSLELARMIKQSDVIQIVYVG